MCKFTRSIVFITCIIAVTSNSLSCYDCIPSHSGRCLSPHLNNIKLTTCTNALRANETGLKKEIDDTALFDIDRSDNSTTKISECFTLYFESGDERTGVYRGCYERPINVLSSCELLQENLKGGNITACATCLDNECNTRDDVGGGAATMTISLTIIILNLLICLNIFDL